MQGRARPDDTAASRPRTTQSPPPTAAVVSHRGVRWAWSITNVTPAQRLVLLALGEVHGHRDGICRPGVATIARMTGLSARHVTRAIRAIEGRGVIRIIAGGGRRAHRYVLVGVHAGARSDPGTVVPLRSPDEPPR